MNAYDICAAGNAHGNSSSRPFQTLIGRQIQGVADKGFARSSQQDGETKCADLVQAVDQFQVLCDRFTESDPRVQQDVLIRDHGRTGDLNRIHQIAFDVFK